MRRLVVLRMAVLLEKVALSLIVPEFVFLLTVPTSTRVTQMLKLKVPSTSVTNTLTNAGMERMIMVTSNSVLVLDVLRQDVSRMCTGSTGKLGSPCKSHLELVCKSHLELVCKSHLELVCNPQKSDKLFFQSNR